MAVYTSLTLADADAIARAHHLDGAHAVDGVLAGSVNSNFFVETALRRVFVRIYEEQDADGVAYEHALLAHLVSHGVPAPRRVDGPPPGALKVAGKPVAVFEVIGGDEVCQRMVDADRAREVGRLLARAHAAGAEFPIRRAGRFTRADLRARLDHVDSLARPELASAVPRLRAILDHVEAAWDPTLPSGVIHGDLFRDNVRWEGYRIVGALDWESASDGVFVYDLAVAMLAWCFDADLRWDLMAAMHAGYRAERPFDDRELAFMRTALCAAAARFTVTRITDYHLREGAQQVKKDWRRFEARLEAVASLSASEVAERLAR